MKTSRYAKVLIFDKLKIQHRRELKPKRMSNFFLVFNPGTNVGPTYCHSIHNRNHLNFPKKFHEGGFHGTTQSN